MLGLLGRCGQGERAGLRRGERLSPDPAAACNRHRCSGERREPRGGWGAPDSPSNPAALQPHPPRPCRPQQLLQQQHRGTVLCRCRAQHPSTPRCNRETQLWCCFAPSQHRCPQKALRSQGTPSVTRSKSFPAHGSVQPPPAPSCLQERQHRGETSSPGLTVLHRSRGGVGDGSTRLHR